MFGQANPESPSSSVLCASSQPLELSKVGHCVTTLWVRVKDLLDTLLEDIQRIRPKSIHIVEPGEWRLRERLRVLESTLSCGLIIHEDRHFLCSHEDFSRHSHGRKQLRMEFFYREMRRKHAVLLDDDGAPVGGQWNYDADNRQSFPVRAADAWFEAAFGL